MAGDHAKGLDGLFETIALLENSGVSAIEVGILSWSDPVWLTVPLLNLQVT